MDIGQYSQLIRPFGGSRAARFQIETFGPSPALN